jgi:hypothetical protein
LYQRGLLSCENNHSSCCSAFHSSVVKVLAEAHCASVLTSRSHVSVYPLCFCLLVVRSCSIAHPLGFVKCFFGSFLQLTRLVHLAAHLTSCTPETERKIPINSTSVGCSGKRRRMFPAEPLYRGAIRENRPEHWSNWIRDGLVFDSSHSMP